MVRVLPPALLVVLLLVSALPGQEAGAPDEAALAARIGAAEDDADRVPLLRLFLDRYPDSDRAVPFLRDLCLLARGGTPDDREATLLLLRKAEVDHPRWRRELESSFSYRSLVEGLAPWRFTWLPGNLAPGRPEVAAVDDRGSPGPRRFRFWRIPPAEVERAWLGAPDEGDALPLPDRARWTGPVREVVVEPGGDALELGPFEAGAMVVEEVVGGLTATSLLSVRSFDVLALRLAGDVLLWARDKASGEPVPELTLRFRTASGTSVARTDGEGLHRVRAAGPVRLLAERAGEMAWQALGEDGVPTDFTLDHLATDRPVYRPGQTVRFRLVRRDPGSGGLSIPEPGPAAVEVRDPAGRVMGRITGTRDADGILAGSFEIPEEAPLGTWTLVTGDLSPFWRFEPWEWDLGLPEDYGRRWRQGFAVEEYRKPEIRVTLAAAEPAEDGSLRVLLRAERAWGGPVAGALVTWWAEARWPEWSGWPAPVSGHPLAWFFVRPPADGSGEEEWGYGDLGGGEGETGPDGTLLLTLAPDVSEPQARNASEFLVNAVVTDLSRLPVAVRAAVPNAGRSATIRIGEAPLWVGPGEAIGGNVTGAPPGAVVEVRALVLPEDGDEGQAEEVWRGTPAADAGGSASFLFPAPLAGKARIVAGLPGAPEEAQDRRDVVIATAAAAEESFWADDGPEPLEMLPDRAVYRSGETARLLVRTPSPGPGILVVVSDGIDSIRPVRLEAPLTVISVPVNAAMAPHAHVLLLAGVEEEALASRVELLVYPAEKILRVAADPERKSYAPGETVRVDVRTLDASGRPAPSVVELAIVDESIFALAPDRTEDVRRAFFPYRPRLLWDLDFTANVAIVRGFHPESWAERQPRFGAVEEGEAFGEGEAAPAGLRRDFADTMHWDARVRTGADGTAKVEVRAPDNLTTWRIVARAVSGPDRFGAGRSEVVTRKEVSVAIAAPRFLTERDECVIGTLVRNDLDDEVEFRVEFRATGLELLSAGPVTVAVPAGGERRVDWRVRAAAAGEAVLTARAASAVMSDAMEVRLPVEPHGALQAASSAGRVDGAWQATLVLPEGAAPETARLAVRADSLAGSLAGAIPFLAGYPYGCVEQTMSRFLPSVVALGAMRRVGLDDANLAGELPKMIDAGLARLYRYQHEDGGWGWWENDGTHPFMTAYVVWGLLTARAADVAVDGPTLARGIDALSALEAEAPTAFGTFVLLLAGREADPAAVAPETVEDRAWLSLAGREGLLDGLPGAPRVVTGETVRTGALLLRALRREAPDDPRVGDLAAWLLASRRGGAWVSTLDTAYAVYALAEMASPPGSLVARVTVNGREVLLREGGAEVGIGALRPGENVVAVTKTGEGTLFASALLRYHDRAAEALAPVAGEFEVTRTFHRVTRQGPGELVSEELASGSEVRVGDELLVEIGVTATAAREFVLVSCPIPAGSEAWPAEEDGEWWWNSWYQRRELRDDRVAVAARELGSRELFTFRLRITHPGDYHVMPARAESMYEPGQSGRSAEFRLHVSGT